MRFMCEKCRGIVHVDDKLAGGQVKCGHCGEVVTVPRNGTSPGAIIGDFVIEREINRGGMGIVYLAQQMSLEREVALKILLQKYANDTEFVTQFIREARSAAKLNHPNIVQAYAVGEEHGVFYFAMEYIDGETMKDVLKRDKVIPVKRASAIIKDIAEALDFAWREQRIVHHDIKPDNIMVTSSGRAKLADLGLAKVSGEIEAENDEDEVLGTPQYISPEQLTGSPTDVRSDLYSLGATFYHFVTGRFPYLGENPNAIARQHLEGTLIPPNQINKDVPRKISDIIVRMMEKDPRQRYQGADAVARELGRFIEENSTRTELLALRNLRERSSAGVQVVKAKKKIFIPIGIAVALVIAGLAALAVYPGISAGRPSLDTSPVEAAVEPAKSPAETPKAEPPPAAPVKSRPEFLSKVDELMKFYQAHPNEEKLFLTRADTFFTGKLYPPVTAEERTAVAKLHEIYSRIDERLRVIPMRLEARKANLREIDQRRADEAKRVADEAKKRAEDAKKERERQRLADEKRKKDEEAQREADRRAARYVQNMDEYVNKITVAFVKAAQGGEAAVFDREANAMRLAAALPVSPTSLERSKNTEVMRYLNQLVAELPKVLNVSRLFLGNTGFDSFQFEPSPGELVRITGAGKSFGELKGKSVLKNREMEFSMSDPDFRSRLVRVVERRLKIDNFEFFYQIAAADFTSTLANSSPSGFWRLNYTAFVKNYLRGAWAAADGKTREEMRKRYGELPEFKQVIR